MDSDVGEIQPKREEELRESPLQPDPLLDEEEIFHGEPVPGSDDAIEENSAAERQDKINIRCRIDVKKLKLPPAANKVLQQLARHRAEAAAATKAVDNESAVSSGSNNTNSGNGSAGDSDDEVVILDYSEQPQEAEVNEQMNGLNFKQFGVMNNGTQKANKRQRKSQDNISVLRDEELQFTDDPSEMCIVECLVCREGVKFLRNHVRAFHTISMAEYRALHPADNYVRKIYHRCKICSKPILFTADTLHTHMMSHKSTGAEYRKQFLSQMKGPRCKSKKLQKKKKKTTASKDEMIVGDNESGDDAEEEGWAAAFCSVEDHEPTQESTCHSRHESASSIKAEEESVCDPLNELASDHGQEETLGVDSDGRIFTDDPSQMCRLTCNLCGNVVKNMRAHVQSQHYLSLKDYKQAHPEVVYALQTYHRCKLCSKVLIFTHQMLAGHLTQHHLSVSAYRNIYLQTDSSRGPTAKGPAAQSHQPAVAAETDNDSPDVDANELTDDISQLSREVCQICGAIQSSLHYHVASEHGKSILEYRHLFPKTGVEKKLYHRCKLCGLKLLFSRLTLHHHMKRHHQTTFRQYKKDYLLSAEEVEGERMERELEGKGEEEVSWMARSDQLDISRPEDEEVGLQSFEGTDQLHENGNLEGEESLLLSDNPENLCIFVCGVCRRHVSNLRPHALTCHQMSMKDYNKLYPEPEFQRKTYHRCQLCGKILLFAAAKIHGHLSTHHGMNWGEYKRQRLNLESQRPDQPVDTSQDDDDDDLPMALPLQVQLEEEHKEPSATPAAEDESDLFLCDDPENLCRFVCGICNRVFKGLRNHVASCHKLSVDQYRQLHPEYRYELKSHHRCRLCGKICLFTIDAVHGHLQTHKINWKEYKMTYLTCEVEKDVEDGNTNLPVMEMPLQVELQEEEEDVDPLETSSSSCLEEPEMLLSDDPGDMSSVLCNICGESFTMLRTHLAKIHQMSAVTYRQMYPHKQYSRKVYHRCRLCLSIMLMSFDKLDSHMRSLHGTTWAVYRRTHLGDAVKREPTVSSHNGLPEAYEEDMLRLIYNQTSPTYSPKGNKRRLEQDDNEDDDADEDPDYGSRAKQRRSPLCQICGQGVSDMRQHIRTKHADWICGDDEEQQLSHRCRLCNASVPLSGAKLKNHLSSHHKVTIKHYGRLNEAGSSTPLKQIKKDKHQDSPLTQMDNRKRIKEEVNEDEVTLANRQDDLCVAVCEICGAEVRVLRAHVKRKHFLSPSDYKSLYSGPVRYAKKTYHRCLLCDDLILFDHDTMHSHLNGRHGCSFPQYRQQYLEKDSQQHGKSSLSPHTTEQEDVKQSLSPGDDDDDVQHIASTSPETIKMKPASEDRMTPSLQKPNGQALHENLSKCDDALTSVKLEREDDREPKADLIPKLKCEDDSELKADLTLKIECEEDNLDEKPVIKKRRAQKRPLESWVTDADDHLRDSREDSDFEEKPAPKKRQSRGRRVDYRDSEVDCWVGSREELNIAESTPPVAGLTDVPLWSDQLEDMVLYRCRMCGRQVGELTAHLRQEHDVTIREYSVAYPGPAIEASSLKHRCKLCSQSMVFNREILNRHLTMVHATHFVAYAAKYLQSAAAKLPPGPNGDLSDKYLHAASDGQPVENGQHEEEEEEEDLVEYEDPEFEGPGPGYKCPINDCVFKTNMEGLKSGIAAQHCVRRHQYAPWRMKREGLYWILSD